MAAALLCGHAGIGNRTIDSSAACIANWYGRLQQDRKLLVHAASAALKAADYILRESPDWCVIRDQVAASRAGSRP